MSKIKKQRVTPTRILLENPYDLETFFESLNIASKNEKELLYMDRFIAALRSNPNGDITTINFSILKELEIIKL
jgi:hypothetical protein